MRATTIFPGKISNKIVDMTRSRAARRQIAACGENAESKEEDFDYFLGGFAENFCRLLFVFPWNLDWLHFENSSPHAATVEKRETGAGNLCGKLFYFVCLVSLPSPPLYLRPSCQPISFRVKFHPVQFFGRTCRGRTCERGENKRKFSSTYFFVPECAETDCRD